ncbi:hypothetical protein ACFTXK_31600 [Streptomyces sp. NPDC056956]|uniref:hypothetical protein n=1 Tax=unclassified Streptomyces TaxID=2593676 RepID=UPI003629F445
MTTTVLAPDPARSPTLGPVNEAPAPVTSTVARARHAEAEREPGALEAPADRRQHACKTRGVGGEAEAFGYSVSVTPFRDACRRRQARTRQRFEQYTAAFDRSTPTVHDRPHTGHSARLPRCIAITRCRVCRSLRHCRDLHRPEQNTASAAIDTGSGSPHSRQYRRAVPSAATSQIIQPYAPHGQSSKTLTEGAAQVVGDGGGGDDDHGGHQGSALA